MSWPRARLLLSATAFFVWSLWLIWQVSRCGSPVMVSQPQLLIAPVVVVATVEEEAAGGPRTAKVEQTLKGDGFVPADRKIHILDWSSAVGAHGSGRYLLALQPVEKERARFLLVPVPVSPGFYYSAEKDIARRVYSHSPSVEFQARQILQPAKKP